MHRVYSGQRGLETMVSDHGLGRGQTGVDPSLRKKKKKKKKLRYGPILSSASSKYVHHMQMSPCFGTEMPGVRLVREEPCKPCPY